MTRSNISCFSKLALFATLIPLVAPSLSSACSRVLWNTNGDLVVAGRSMDWGHAFDDVLYIVPRGDQMDGGLEENPATWTVKYGGVTSAISGWLMSMGSFSIDDGATDGLNEKGLAAHLL